MKNVMKCAKSVKQNIYNHETVDELQFVLQFHDETVLRLSYYTNIKRYIVQREQKFMPTARTAYIENMNFVVFSYIYFGLTSIKLTPLNKKKDLFSKLPNIMALPRLS